MWLLRRTVNAKAEAGSGLVDSRSIKEAGVSRIE